MARPVEERWKLVPHFLLRRAGFTFSLLDSLRYRDVAAAAATVATAAETVEGLRLRLLKELFPAEVSQCAARGAKPELRVLSAWRRAVGRGTAYPIPASGFSPQLCAAVAALEEARVKLASGRARLEASLGAEMLAARDALRKTFGRSQVREALFLLTPDLLETMEGALDRRAVAAVDSGERSFERRLFAFLQRLAAKNETTSFFGPLAYGEVASDDRPTGLGAEHPSGVVRREVFAAFWAATAFARAASNLPAVRRAVPPRRVPVARLDGEVAIAPDGERVSLSPLQRRLFEAADGKRSVPALTEALGAPLNEVEAALLALERKLLVRRDLEPLSTAPHPLRRLRAELPTVPEIRPILEAIDSFEALLADFAAADLPERRRLLPTIEAQFTAATGQPARRAAGQVYADRSVLYEDCLGDMQPVTLSRKDGKRLEAALAPALELGAAYGALRAASLRALAAEVVEGRGGQMPFLEFAAALDAKITSGALRDRDAPARALITQLEERVKAREQLRGGARVAQLSVEEIEALVPAVPLGRFASPDVMIHTVEGGSRFVIGEVHPYVFAWGSQGYFSPDRERFLAAFREDLSPWGGPDRLATVLRRRRHKGLVSEDFPGLFVEISGRASVDPTRRMAVADLVVRRTESGAELFGPSGPLTLYAGEDDHPHLRAFAPPAVEMPPIRLGAHTPRVEIGDLVLQRERWLFAPGELSSLQNAEGPAELAIAVAAARARHGLPEVVFALSPSEPKPVCLPLEVPFAQQLLQRLLKLGPLTLSEMLPPPDGLWVRRAEGTHTSELRMALIRRE